MEAVYAADQPIDFDGAHYRLRQAVSVPKPLQRPRPITMNAAFSGPGREFAAQHCDFLFTTFAELEAGKTHVADMRSRGAAIGKTLGVFTVGHVVCRPTQAEAEDYYDRYSRQHVDQEAVDYHVRQKKNFANSHSKEAFELYKHRFAAGTGNYPLVGTPQRIVDEPTKFIDAGFSGAALAFVNYRNDLPYFCQTVVPMIAEASRRAA